MRPASKATIPSVAVNVRCRWEMPVGDRHTVLVRVYVVDLAVGVPFPAPQEQSFQDRCTARATNDKNGIDFHVYVVFNPNQTATTGFIVKQDEIDHYGENQGYLGDGQDKPAYVSIPVCAYRPSEEADLILSGQQNKVYRFHAFRCVFR